MFKVFRIAKPIVGKCIVNRRLSIKETLSNMKSNISTGAGIVISTVLAMVTFVIALGYASLKEMDNDSHLYMVNKKLLSSKISKAEVDTGDVEHLKSEAIFINRAKEKSIITSIIERNKANGKYFIVYGNKGEGKSSLVDEAISGKIGIIKLKVNSAMDKGQIIAQLANLLGIQEKASIDDFVHAIRTASIGRKSLITLVFDIERSGAGNAVLGIDAVRSISKEFASACNCIIILSEANAVLEFGNDDSRESFEFIGGFTVPEATEYITKLGLSLKAEERDYVFNKIGTSPAVLRDMHDQIVNKKCTVNEFVNQKVKKAHNELVAFPLQPILKALKEHPEGVEPDYFKKQKFEGVDLSNPKAVGVAMKQVNSIVYRIEDGKYKIISTAHATALKSYDPISIIGK